VLNWVLKAARASNVFLNRAPDPAVINPGRRGSRIYSIGRERLAVPYVARTAGERGAQDWHNSLFAGE